MSCPCMVFAITSKVLAFWREKLTLLGPPEFLEVRSALSPLRSVSNEDRQFPGVVSGECSLRKWSCLIKLWELGGIMRRLWGLDREGRMQFCTLIDLGMPHQGALWAAECLHGFKGRLGTHQREIPHGPLNTGSSWAENNQSVGKNMRK